MKLRDALKLHNEDEVIVKKTKIAGTVVEVEILTKEQSPSGTASVRVMLENGNWYGHKEIL